MQIAAIKYRTRNLGDDIQAVALERLLPRVDLWIDRDDVGEAAHWDDDVRWILNGWYDRPTHRVWPPPGNARKLFIGFHATNGAVIPKEQDHPIGCRDPWTFQQCTQQGIEAWMSFCTTLTLQPNAEQADREEILLVDLKQDFIDRLPPEIASGMKLTHWISPDCDRFDVANQLLERYARAKWVVTSRLHALLPCAAMGTPVVFSHPNWEKKRYLCYTHLAWTVDTAPWNSPQPRFSSEVVHAMSSPLREVIHRFIEE